MKPKPPHRIARFPCSVMVAMLLGSVAVAAETGHEAWLRNAAIANPASYAEFDRVAVLGRSQVLGSAESELRRGWRSLTGRELRLEDPGYLGRPEAGSAATIVLATSSSLRPFPAPADAELRPDGYRLQSAVLNGHRVLLVVSPTDRGVLYGVFDLLRRVALQEPIATLDEKQNPALPIRWVNQWDNLDGSIERGYGGRSIFFAGGNVRADLTRAREYARLLASLGINGCVVNNVNADSRMLSPAFLPQLVRLADAFRSWGVGLAIAVDFSSPKAVGGLDSFDPLDPRVARWWSGKADEIYRAIPDFAGFLVKADSEGRQGPSAYGRTHAQGANVLARALQPHGGVLMYRAFVYNHHLDFADRKADRARAAFDNFAPLDGEFADNVIVQIKYGPIDFQVREPVSPLIAALARTNQAIELQITQEYTGQQKHLCYLAPMWKEILDFDLRVAGAATPVREIVAGTTFRRPLGGIVGVANVGDAANWLGFDLAQANLYAFGRLAWNPSLNARDLAEEWTRLTFGADPLAVKTIVDLQMESWPAYEKYTGSPLGLQTLTNIVGNHYDPGPESADGNGWGQWIRAERDGIGMDRTVSTGTGFAGQYPPAVAATFESLQACPENLLLFFHHVPYTYGLKSGKTVIQTIYDTHGEGAAQARTFPQRWKTLESRIDHERYQVVLDRLEGQAAHALVWRDTINAFFFHVSGIPDARASGTAH